MAIMQGPNIIQRGLQSKEMCKEEGLKSRALAVAVQSLIQLFSDNSTITYTCCSWSCCNYNRTTLALASYPTTITTATTKTAAGTTATTTKALNLSSKSLNIKRKLEFNISNKKESQIEIEKEIPGSIGVNTVCNVQLINTLILSIFLFFD